MIHCWSLDIPSLLSIFNMYYEANVLPNANVLTVDPIRSFTYHKVKHYTCTLFLFLISKVAIELFDTDFH